MCIFAVSKKGSQVFSIARSTLNNRFAQAWRDAAVSAIAAGIAWVLAIWLFGHPHPVFAAVTAIVCLSPGLPSHGKQAVGLMLGVATGIVIGEAAFFLLPEGLLVPDGLSLLRLTVATFFSILIAAGFGQAAVVAIQAGCSAVLVLALGPHSAGLVRLEDVVVGVTVGLFFSQVLLTPNPVRQIDVAASDLFRGLSRSFEDCVEALKHQNTHKAISALNRFSAAHASLIALSAGIDSARYEARWSLRGRLAKRSVVETAARYDRAAIRLYASSLLFGEAFSDVMRKNMESAPEGLADCLVGVASRCACLAGEKPSITPHTPASEILNVPAEWQSAVDHLRAASRILEGLEVLHLRSTGTVATKTQVRI